MGRKKAAEAPAEPPAVAAGELAGERLEIRYVRVSDARRWDRNAKRHDIGGLIESFRSHGFRDAPVYDAALGAIAAGNGRATALEHMLAAGEDPPRGILIADDGEWCMPMQFGVDAASREQAEAFGVDHNNLTLTGADLGFHELVSLYDHDRLIPILADLVEAGAPLITLDAADLETLVHPPPPVPREIGVELPGQPESTCPKCGHKFCT